MQIMDFGNFRNALRQIEREHLWKNSLINLGIDATDFPSCIDCLVETLEEYFHTTMISQWLWQNNFGEYGIDFWLENGDCIFIDSIELLYEYCCFTKKMYEGQEERRINRMKQKLKEK